MKAFTVILGDFPDFPGVWNEVHVCAPSIADVDVKAAAREAFDHLCEEKGEPLPEYTLVGIYEGHIVNMECY
jgi:hypothetical protein